ncbi:hypothetical protein [Streptomyces recifensis]|uniref:hypothetical protein n=1 Tax=Streptomyces recifensis TaxID=67355 RepID=UPI001FC94F55|nr:hypothetical protein [Streptomyces recifensis]
MGVPGPLQQLDGRRKFSGLEVFPCVLADLTTSGSPQRVGDQHASLSCGCLLRLPLSDGYVQVVPVTSSCPAPRVIDSPAFG